MAQRKYPNIEAQDVVSRLFEVAVDSNIDVLSDLFRDAGILWKCDCCGEDNAESETECGFCDGN